MFAPREPLDILCASCVPCPPLPCVAQGHGPDGDFTGVVRMRGMPYDASTSSVVSFFSGIPLEESAVVLVKTRKGASLLWAVRLWRVALRLRWGAG